VGFWLKSGATRPTDFDSAIPRTSMHPIVSTYRQMDENSCEVTETIRGGRQTMADLLKAGGADNQRAAMLCVAKLKRAINELNTSFHQLESMTMTYKG
jgi:hypothetical protein